MLTFSISFLHLQNGKSSTFMLCKDAAGIQTRKLGRRGQKRVPERRECSTDVSNPCSTWKFLCCNNFIPGFRKKKILLPLNHKVKTGNTKDQAVNRKLLRTNLTKKIIKNFLRKYLCSWEMPVYWNFLKKNKFLLRKVTQVQGGFSDQTKRERHQFQNVLMICRVNDKTDLSSNHMHDETWHRELNLRLHISSWPG